MNENLLLVDLVKVLDSFQDDAHLLEFVKLLKRYNPYFAEISSLLYEKLDSEDRWRFIVWLLKRWAGLNQVNTVEMNLFLDTVKRLKDEQCEELLIDGVDYNIRDLKSQGYDFKLAAHKWFLGVTDIYYNQYEHKEFCVRPGDVIIDAGGFIGDTAALFCVKTRGDCFVHSFEVLNENLKLFEFNVELNGISKNVKINRLALTNRSGGVIGVKPATLQGATCVSDNSALEEQVETITLDDYVIRNNLDKVSLIKMDIEGSEIPALKGAINTIRHFRPRLALCVYHKWDDIITIPRFLAETGVDYDFCFKWVHLTQGWEAVLLASPVSDKRTNF
ncbi:FkbM family methyltransferase [Pseudomonas lopnurensis]|uniref:FkbM family methyltransferase n=1 Tax=Pseudomonas lopnurensis TaxID=1477517 RepID=UPI0028B0803A|nr:FkbM family methyltransferase [Pseudomonas lopnurensis]